MNANLPRWILASVATHFETVASGISLPFFVEGINERESSTSNADHAELRTTGPFIKELSNDYFNVSVVINVLLTNYMNTTGGAYDLEGWCGTFQTTMLDPISIYKYGSGAGDDDSLIGCLRIKKNRNDAVKVFNFGQLSGVDRIRQAEVDATYEMDLIGSEL